MTGSGRVCFSGSIRKLGRSRFPVAVEQLYGVHRQGFTSITLLYDGKLQVTGGVAKW